MEPKIILGILDSVSFALTVGGFVPIVIEDVRRRNIVIIVCMTSLFLILSFRFIRWRNYQQEVDDMANKIVRELNEVRPKELTKSEIKAKLSLENSKILDPALNFALKNEIIQYDTIRLQNKQQREYSFIVYSLP